MAHVYLIRHGLMRRVSRFASELGGLARGQTVVVRSLRGTELGEVLVEDNARAPQAPPASVLRIAAEDDLHRARWAECERQSRLEACSRILGQGRWPLELIDVEPMLDDARTVLHYLGPHRLDTSGLHEALRAATQLDVVFEAAGRDEPEESDESHGCGHCSAGGGCGAGSTEAGCGSSSHSCSGCAVKELVGARRAAV
jgi:cell fate regulator YaaT (PSP1 superfamily)